MAKPGLLLRLTRNLDKQRGFVNGAVAVVRDVPREIFCEYTWTFLARRTALGPNKIFPVLRGNAVFTVEVVGENRRAGTLFLVHPTEEDGNRFLP